jgi:AmmeMemoRadiSam system protein A/AmmeMemoRadiSam system protein B
MSIHQVLSSQMPGVHISSLPIRSAIHGKIWSFPDSMSFDPALSLALRRKLSGVPARAARVGWQQFALQLLSWARFDYCWRDLLGNAIGIESAIVFSGIAPHPPIMVPEVGGESILEVRRSIEAMAELTRRIVRSGAETVVLISPHAPLDEQAFVAYHTPQLHGDFANFRAPDARIEFPLDEDLLNAITQTAAEHDYEVMNLDECMLDHGTAVPLYFLDRYGWRGRVVALGYSFLSNEDHLSFGNCLRRAIDLDGRSVAIVASGDLSHRLKPEAPAGYNPAAHRFDEEVVEALQDNSPKRIIDIDPDLRRTAGECGYRSMLVALGATDELTPACDVLNYEAPFGVGYLVAQLTNATAKTQSKVVKQTSAVEHATKETVPTEDLPALARKAIETFVLTGKQITAPAKSSALLSARASCFVSIKTHAGDLRGCIGTIEPTRENLGEELITNAINAATRDPRFDPVSADELAELCYSVDILGAPETTSFESLDPKIYGVIVEDESGRLRGLLLPDIAGVDTARQQVDIAARKAGIAPGTPLRLSRFRVSRFREQ